MSYVDVAERYLKVKKSGRHYFGLCPFHEEKTPSWNIEPDTGTWHCFGCGASGNIWQLIMKMESVSFPESVEIARDYGVEPPDNFIEKKEKTKIYSGPQEEEIPEYVEEIPYMPDEEEEIKPEENKKTETPENEVKPNIEMDFNAKIRIAEKLEETGVKPAKEKDKEPLPKKPAPLKIRNAEKPKTEEKKTAVYIYEDLDGKIVYEKERWEKYENGVKVSKRFLFYHYENAKRVAGKGEESLILYNLKDVVNFPDVFICEGEKDADNLKKLWTEKACAFTTNAAGAGAWDSAYNGYFKNKNAIVLEDNDEAGRKRTQALKDNIEKIAASFKVVTFEELEEHGDVSDYIEKFGIEPLVQKVKEKREEKKPPETIKIDVFELNFYKDKNEYILNNFIPLKKGKRNFFAGSGIDFFIYVSLILSRKYGILFISKYGYEELEPYFSDIVKRMRKSDKQGIRDVFFSTEYKEKPDSDGEIIVVSTDYMEEKDETTVICPNGENLPDYVFKNGTVYDKFFNQIIAIENLKGNGEIRIANLKGKKSGKLRFLRLKRD